ncbi:MAG: hypothetical protein ABH871_05545 [Pseudomonadota bacterium]
MRIKAGITASIVIALIIVFHLTASALDESQESVPDKVEWQELVSEEGGFTIMMPDTPTFNISIQDTAVGDIEENAYSLKTKEAEYNVEYLDLPFIARIFGRKIIFKRAKTGLLKDEKGKEISFVNIKQEGIRGAELVFETRKQRGKARFLLKREKLYVLIVTVSKKSDEDEVMDKFLDSFKIIEKKRKPL